MPSNDSRLSFSQESTLASAYYFPLSWIALRLVSLHFGSLATPLASTTRAELRRTLVEHQYPSLGCFDQQF